MTKRPAGRFALDVAAALALGEEKALLISGLNQRSQGYPQGSPQKLWTDFRCGASPPYLGVEHLSY